jgi:hypothetical protein
MFIPMFLITLEAPDFNQNKTSDLKKTQETKEIEKKENLQNLTLVEGKI